MPLQSTPESSSLSASMIPREAHDEAMAAALQARLPATPLVHLTCLERFTPVPILAKAEFKQAGGSIKDRTALGMIFEAELTGKLSAGGHIIDATAGNTGIGLATYGRERGYTVTAVIPHGISREKVHLLQAAGARVLEVDEGDDYRQRAEALALETPKGWWVNQFDNVANRRTHYLSTGPEIWAQSHGKISAFVASVGTGGTLVGTSQFLKERNPALRAYCADPTGASLWSWIKTGVLEPHGPESIAEGIGQTRLTGNLRGARLDDALQVPDSAAIAMLTFLRDQAGICVGLSAAINVCAAVHFSRHSPTDGPVATILCDCGNRYLSSLHNPAWLQQHHLLPTPDPMAVLNDFFSTAF